MTWHVLFEISVRYLQVSIATVIQHKEGGIKIQPVDYH